MEQTTPSKNRKVIASVQNALNILNLFGEERSELGNAEIAKILNMDPGTVAGLVYTLKINKYLDQNPTNHKYRLGLKIAERALLLLNQMDLRKIAAPYLEELRECYGESINLGVLDNQEVVYIERLFGFHALGIRSELGKRAPIHSTALGKAIAAFLPEIDLNTLLKDYKFWPVTSHSITDRHRFDEELITVRNCGYAVDNQENELGGRCIGAPIFNHQGSPIAAVSMSIPIQRFPDEKIPEYGQQVISTAAKISRDHGYIK
ncbi:MAG: IclR family transcriptional regulator [Anaerolineaceae bacterium]